MDGRHASDSVRLLRSGKTSLVDRFINPTKDEKARLLRAKDRSALL